MSSPDTDSRYVVLVVDDLPEMRDMRKFFLEDEGYRVVEAEDGSQGVTAAIRERPRLILMNYLMPVMNGLTAAQEIHRQPGLERVPIILNSACDPKRTRQVALDAGCVDYIVEPCCHEELMQKVEAHILVG